MSFYTLYEHCVTVQYRGRVCSSGFVLAALCSLLAVVAPWLLLQLNGSLWLKYDTQHVPLDVHFGHDAMIALHVTPNSPAAPTAAFGRHQHHSSASPPPPPPPPPFWQPVGVPYRLWSTLDVFRVLMPQSARALPLVAVDEPDTDGDARRDLLRLRAEFALDQPELSPSAAAAAAAAVVSVSAVQALLTFTVYVDGAVTSLGVSTAPRLVVPALVHLPTVQYSGHQRAPAERVDIACDLQLVQRHLVSQTHTDAAPLARHRSLHNFGPPTAAAAAAATAAGSGGAAGAATAGAGGDWLGQYDKLTLAAVVSDQLRANMSLRMRDCHTVWSPLPLAYDNPVLAGGATAGHQWPRRFVVALTVQYPAGTVPLLVRPGRWRVLLAAWLQYVPLLVTAAVAARALKRWAFVGSGRGGGSAAAAYVTLEPVTAANVARCYGGHID